MLVMVVAAYFYEMRIAMVLVFFFGLCVEQVRSQLLVSVPKNEAALQDSFRVNARGLDVERVSFSGSNAALAFFNLNMIYNQFPDRGILLSTGDARLAKGPNDQPMMGSSNRLPGSSSLSQLLGAKTFDAATLTVEFTAQSDSFSFNYLFASEEYPEFVGRNANDVFAFFLTDMETGKRSNLAVLSDGKTPVCVDEVNELKNTELYTSNARWDKENIRQWESKRQQGELALLLQYDGFAGVLSAGSRLERGKRYKLILSIADSGDDRFDSAVFVELKSFKGYVSDQPLVLNAVPDFDGVVVERNGVELKLIRNVHFDIGLSELTDTTDLRFLAELSQWLTTEPFDSMVIFGYTDTIGTQYDNLELSLERAEAVMEWLAKSGIDQRKLKVIEMGESSDGNDLARNRRVEFVILGTP